MTQITLRGIDPEIERESLFLKRKWSNTIQPIPGRFKHVTVRFVRISPGLLPSFKPTDLFI